MSRIGMLCASLLFCEMTLATPPPATPLSPHTPAGFAVDTQFPGDPQANALAENARRLLGLMGLRESPDAGWHIRLLKNTSLPCGEYHLQGSAEGVRIEASDAEGVRRGVSAFLHELGVRWFDPASEPLLPAIPAPLPDFQHQSGPSFPYRGLHICGAPDHYDPRLADWMSFQGMNRKLTHIPELERVGGALKRQGLSPDTTVHSYSLWIPDEIYFASHPEFFALVGGRRIPHREGGQLCLANRAMRAAFLREARSYLDAHPEVSVIGICPDDGYGWCECPACAALDTAEDRAAGKVNARVADFVEELCRGLQESHPQTLVGHYSYSIFSDFSHHLKSPPPNLLVSCTTARCYKHGIDAAECPVNRDIFQRLRTLRDRVRHVYVYDYMFYRWEGLPHPQWRVIGRDVAAYAKLGLDGYMTEAPPANAKDYAAAHLSLYTLARLLTDRQTDVGALLDDYCARRFEKAAVPMRSYLTLWEDALAGMEGCLTHGGDDLERLIQPEFSAKASILLDQAMRSATGAAAEAVRDEQKLFQRWMQILEARRVAAQKLPVRIGTMEEFHRDIERTTANDEGLSFLDHTLKIAPQDHSTRARLYADRDALGLVIECEEPEMRKISDKPGDSLGAVCGSEHVEIFLRDGQDERVCYHFLVSISGGQAASECHGSRWNWAWESGTSTEVRRSEGFWKVGMKIPLSKIRADRKLAFSLIRNRFVHDWQKSGVPEGGVFFNTSRYLETNLPE